MPEYKREKEGFSQGYIKTYKELIIHQKQERRWHKVKQNKGENGHKTEPKSRENRG